MRSARLRSMSTPVACVLCGLVLLAGWVEVDGRELQHNPSRALAVIGGGDTYRRSYMVSLRSKGLFFCAGTLIAPNVVLTSAVCLHPTRSPTVHVGRLYRTQDDEFEEFNTIEAIRHPQYNSGSFDNDIALLVLDAQSSKTPVMLESSESCFESNGGCEVKVLGWGRTANGKAADVLQEGTTKSVGRSTCEAQYGASTITSAMICAGEPEGGIDSCIGDSGGPLLLSGKQVGISSFGALCGKSAAPGVYTSVPKLLGWIQQELKRISGSKPSQRSSSG